MGELLPWLLAATALCVLVGWQLRRRRAAERQRLQAQAEAGAERQRLAAEQADRERLAAEQAQREAQRAAADKAQQEAQRLAAAREQAARQAALRAEEQRQAALRAEAERSEAERQAAERREAERAEAERRAAEAAHDAQRLAAEAAAAAAPPEPKSPSQTLVLVADDSKVVRIKTGRLLAQHGYRVSHAGDGLEALQQLQAQAPDVLITDVEMPGMDGFELTRHIRDDPRTAGLPVIMITAADDRHRAQADAAGVSVLLGKPYADDELLAHIRLAMGQDAAALA